MDSIEFSILTEVCSTNYSGILTAAYEKFSRTARDELLPIEALLTSDNPVKSYLLSKPEIDYFSLLHNRIFTALTDYDFKCHFKVSKTIAEELIQLFDKRQKERRWIGRPSMEVSRTVLIGLWFLVSNEPYRLLCDRFSIAIGHSNQTVRIFLSTLAALKEKYIVWPRGRDALRVEREFEDVTEVLIPGVIGCIDSCQVKARRNKSRVYSFIIMQAVSDAKGMFTDVFCGEASEMSDTRVFSSSDLGKKLMLKPRMMLKPSNHILGNEGYPLLTSVITPFDETVSSTKHKLFNRLIDNYRGTVKAALASLFGRFKRLGFLDLFKTNELNHAVIAACIIHNMCILKDDLCLEPPGLVAYGFNNFSDIKDFQPSSSAREKRDNLLEETFGDEEFEGTDDDDIMYVKFNKV